MSIMTVTLTEVAADHKRLRDLLEHIEADPAGCPQRAAELSAELARHEHDCTAVVLTSMVAGDPAYGIDRRLLVSATRGIDHLAMRLQAPCRGADTFGRLCIALRELLHEHERIECELVMAALGDDPAEEPGFGDVRPEARGRQAATARS